MQLLMTRCESDERVLQSGLAQAVTRALMRHLTLLPCGSRTTTNVTAHNHYKDTIVRQQRMEHVQGCGRRVYPHSQRSTVVAASNFIEPLTSDVIMRVPISVAAESHSLHRLGVSKRTATQDSLTRRSEVRRDKARKQNSTESQCTCNYSA